MFSDGEHPRTRRTFFIAQPVVATELTFTSIGRTTTCVNPPPPSPKPKVASSSLAGDTLLLDLGYLLRVGGAAWKPFRKWWYYHFLGRKEPLMSSPRDWSVCGKPSDCCGS